MKPTGFKGQTGILEKPPGMTNKECVPLPRYTDGDTCISCWKLSLRDRLRLVVFGRIWLGVRSGMTQPPVWLDTRNQIFEKRES